MKAQLKRLVHEAEDSLYHLFLRKTNDPQESRDLLQDLYLSVLGNLDSFSLAEDRTAWLFRVAYNKVTDWYRKKKRRNTLSIDGGAEEDDSLLGLLPGLLTTENKFFRDALIEALYEAVEALPEKLGAVIKEQALGERTFSELSEEWSVPVGTLLSRKRKALVLLKEALEDFSDVWYEMENDSGGNL